MKLLHIADSHLGLLRHSRPDPSTGLPSALLSVARCWSYACDIAADLQVDLVIVAGDVFQTPNPDAASLALFKRGLERLQCDVLIYPGNHDRAPHPGRPCVLEAFDDPRHITVATRPGTFDRGGLAIGVLPSVSRHHLMAGFPGFTRIEADQAVVDGLRRIIDQLRTDGADILTGHWPVAGAVLGTERDIAITGEPMLLPSDLEGFRYAAMGHIHKHQTIPFPLAPGSLGFVGAYAGSIDRCDFGEEREAKGVLEVTLGEGPIQVGLEFHETPARRFLTVEFADREVTPEEYLGQAEGAIVRLRMPDHHLDPAPFMRELQAAGAHMVYPQVPSKREVTRRAETVTEALGPMDALDEFLRLRGVKDEERPFIRDLAKGLAEEVGA